MQPFGQPSRDVLRGRGHVDHRHDYDLWLTCDDCGDVFVHAELCALRYDAATRTHTLCYPCSVCGAPHMLTLAGDDVESLQSVGFAVIPAAAPEELLQHRPSADRLGADDVVRFRAMLDSTDLVARLLDESQKRP